MRSWHSAVALIILGFAAPAAAAFVPPECATGTAPVSECGVDSLVGVFVLVAQWIFGIAGAIALIMFIVGGGYWLLSGGNMEKVKKGQSIMVQTVIALAIIFAAQLGVNYLIGALRGRATGTTKPVYLIEGEPCNVGVNNGTVYRVGPALKCVTSCTDLYDDGYSEKTPDPSLECIPGLVADRASGNQCCRGR